MCILSLPEFTAAASDSVCNNIDTSDSCLNTNDYTPIKNLNNNNITIRARHSDVQSYYYTDIVLMYVHGMRNQVGISTADGRYRFSNAVGCGSWPFI